MKTAEYRTQNTGYRRGFALFLFTILCFLSSDAYAALRTFTSAGVNNLWSNAANWDTGVPVDTDTFALAAGQTCEFNADHTGWAGLGASTIASGTTLIATTTAGAYVLKMNADLTVNGTLQAGTSRAVPYPSTCTFTVNFSSGAGNFLGTGVILLYCREPTTKYVATSEALAVGEGTVLDPIDYTGTDISSDWAVNDYVVISDATVPGTIDIERLQISAISSTQLTLAVGVAAAKVSGAKVALLTRNIRIINSTNANGVIYNMTSCTVDAELYGNSTSALYLLYSSNIGGTCYSSTYALNFGFSVISDCVMLSSSLINCYSVTQNTLITGNSAGGTTSHGLIFTESSLIFQCTAGISASGAIISYGEFAYCGDGFLRCSGLKLAGIFTNCTNDIDGCGSGSSFDTTFGTVEFNNYNAAQRSSSDYFESYDHDGTVNAFKAWCRGGIVTSSTTSPPTGYTTWYAHACESATYPCFRQWQYVIAPDETLVVTGKMRIPAATDMSANPPKFQIIDFVDSTQTPLATMSIPVSNGTNTSWQDMSIAYTNVLASPMLVLIRTTATHATQQVDECVYVPDMPAQVATIYTKLPTNYIMGSSVVTDKDDEIDAILVDTDTTIPALIAGITVDNGAIADEVVLHMDANSTDLNDILTDTSAFDTVGEHATAIWNAATGSYGGAGTYGQAVEDILVDTTAYDTDAEHAAAIWNALMATYTIELSFGGDLQQLDPNITLIKAVTDIMEVKNTTVSAADDSNSFTITAGLAVADAYEGLTIYIKDATDGNWDAQLIVDYTSARIVTVDAPFAFVPAVGDIVVIWGLTDFPIDVANGLPLPPEGETITIDMRASTPGGGVTTLSETGEDP